MTLGDELNFEMGLGAWWFSSELLRMSEVMGRCREQIRLNWSLQRVVGGTRAATAARSARASAPSLRPRAARGRRPRGGPVVGAAAGKVAVAIEGGGAIG